MMAAVQHGLYPDMSACAAEWVDPQIGAAMKPSENLAAMLDKTFPLYVEARKALRPIWRGHHAVKQEALHAS
jgi:erythritol kinase